MNDVSFFLFLTRSPKRGGGWLRAGLVAGVLAGAGCSIIPAPKEDPTRHYVLSSVVGGGGEREEAAVDAPVVGLQTVRVASFLNGRAMVVRTGAHEVSFREYARWAEPLEVAITRVVAGWLAEAPGVRQVWVQPFPLEGKRDFEVGVRVTRCEGKVSLEGEASVGFAAVVEVRRAGVGGELVYRSFYEPALGRWDGRDHGALAAGLSEAVNGLGAAVVEAVAVARGR